MRYREWIISRTYPQPYNDCLIAPACMCTLYFVRYLMYTIEISLKCAIMSLTISSDGLIQISMELSILYIKELLIKISIKWCISVPEDCFILPNSANHDEIPPYAVFHQSVHFLPMFLFTDIQNVNGYDTNTNPAPPLHIPVGLNFLFPSFESKI